MDQRGQLKNTRETGARNQLKSTRETGATKGRKKKNQINWSNKKR